jgi:hypothetical protein
MRHKRKSPEDVSLNDILLTLVLAASVLAITHRSVDSVSNLFPEQLPRFPRIIPNHALLLYIAMPASVLSAVVVFLAPGALLVMNWGKAAGIAELLLKAFLGSFFMRFFLHSLWKVLGREVDFAAFVGFEILMTGCLSLLLWFRHRRSGNVTVLKTHEAWRFVRLLAVSYVFLVAFLPEIFWKDLIGDGFETLYSGGTLTQHIITRFNTPSTFYGLGIGLLSQAYPVSWFGLIFGFSHASARLPLAMYILGRSGYSFPAPRDGEGFVKSLGN